MTLPDFLKNLALDTWYKALVYLGGTLFALSLFLDVKGLTNPQLQLLASGAFLFGLGRWKNQKVVAWIKPPNAYTGGAALIQRPVRKPDILGVLLELFGVILFLLGLWRILFR